MNDVIKCVPNAIQFLEPKHQDNFGMKKMKKNRQESRADQQLSFSSVWSTHALLMASSSFFWWSFETFQLKFLRKLRSVLMYIYFVLCHVVIWVFLTRRNSDFCRLDVSLICFQCSLHHEWKWLSFFNYTKWFNLSIIILFNIRLLHIRITLMILNICSFCGSSQSISLTKSI